MPLERLVGPALVVDLSEKAARDADALLTRADLDGFEAERGVIPPGTIVLVRTGWDRWWDDRAHYLGTAVPGDTAHLHFPGVAGEAAAWLTTARRIRAVGIDTASIDRGASVDFRAHRAFANANTRRSKWLRVRRQIPRTIRSAPVSAGKSPARGAFERFMLW